MLEVSSGSQTNYITQHEGLTWEVYWEEETEVDYSEVNSSRPRMCLIANREEPLLHIKCRISRTWGKLELKVNKNP